MQKMEIRSWSNKNKDHASERKWQDEFRHCHCTNTTHHSTSICQCCGGGHSGGVYKPRIISWWNELSRMKGWRHKEINFKRRYLQGTWSKRKFKYAVKEDVRWVVGNAGKTKRKLNGNSGLISDHITYMVM